MTTQFGSESPASLMFAVHDKIVFYSCFIYYIATHFFQAAKIKNNCLHHKNGKPEISSHGTCLRTCTSMPRVTFTKLSIFFLHSKRRPGPRIILGPIKPFLCRINTTINGCSGLGLHSTCSSWFNKPAHQGNVSLNSS